MFTPDRRSLWNERLTQGTKPALERSYKQLLPAFKSLEKRKIECNDAFRLSQELSEVS